jgi:hypothetical protein
MNRTALVLASVLSLAGLAAHAETPDPSGQFAPRVSTINTRAQVRAELQEAQRIGALPAHGELGVSLAQLDPSAAGKSRAEVKAETVQAIRAGDILVAGDAALTERQLHFAR